MSRSYTLRIFVVFAALVLSLLATSAVQAQRLSAVTSDPSWIYGGNTAVGTVYLNAPAPAGGAWVSLTGGIYTYTSSDLGGRSGGGSYSIRVASFPSWVYVPAGATAAAFTISTYYPGFWATVDIHGNYKANATTYVTIY
jgi:hypothetical protein